MSYATEFRRDAVLQEIARLKQLLTKTEISVAMKIEKHNPPEQMDESDLNSYLNLIHRTLKKRGALEFPG